MSLGLKQVHEAFDTDIFDSNGNSVAFGSTIEGNTIAVFIRHFFCGTCKMYVEQLATVRAEALAAASTRIIVIGCGEWKAIGMYAVSSGFTGPIYSDPSRTLYKRLGITIENLNMAEKPPKYTTTSRLQNTLTSAWNVLKHSHLIGSQGKLSQLGGEFIFNNEKACTFHHVMVNTEDHTEVEDLMRAASVEFP